MKIIDQWEYETKEVKEGRYDPGLSLWNERIVKLIPIIRKQAEVLLWYENIMYYIVAGLHNPGIRARQIREDVEKILGPDIEKFMDNNAELLDDLAGDPPEERDDK